MLKYVYDNGVAPTINAAVDTITAVATPVLETAYSAATTVASWVRPLPAGSPTMWKYGNFQTIAQNQVETLLRLFKDSAERRKLSDHHILCALHHPGFALDLFVVYDQKGIHDELVINHYVHWRGNNRDRLFLSICTMIEKEPAFYEPLIRQQLENRDSQLFQALHGHRFNYSYPAIGGLKPETLMQVNNLLREIELNRIRSGVKTPSSIKRTPS
jgi:hypothetical protein